MTTAELEDFLRHRISALTKAMSVKEHVNETMGMYRLCELYNLIFKTI